MEIEKVGKKWINEWMKMFTRWACTVKMLHHFNMFPNKARVTIICMFAVNYADIVYCLHTFHHLFINDLYTINIDKSSAIILTWIWYREKLHSHTHTHLRYWSSKSNRRAKMNQPINGKEIHIQYLYRILP